MVSLGNEVQLDTAALAQHTACQERPLSCVVLLRVDMLVPLASGSTAVGHVAEEEEEGGEEGVDWSWRRRVVVVLGVMGRMPETTRGSEAVVV